MSMLSEEIRRRTIKPNPNKRYYIGQMGVNSSYGQYPADLGCIIPKLLNLGKDEALLRLGQLQEYNGKDQYECGQCGNKFISMRTRDSHYVKRHGVRRGPQIKNLDELTDQQREAVRYEMANEYYTSPSEFMIGDPDDRAVAQEERMAQEIAPINWDKTKASKEE